MGLRGTQPQGLIGTGYTAVQYSSERGDATQARVLLATGEAAAATRASCRPPGHLLCLLSPVISFSLLLQANAACADKQGRSPVDNLRITHPDTAAPTVLGRVLAAATAAAPPSAAAPPPPGAAAVTTSAALSDMLCCRRRS